MKSTMVVVGFVIALVVGLAGGYCWGYASGGNAMNASYAQKIAAVDRLFPPSPTSTLSLTGTVTSVNGSVITMNANNPTPNPFAVGNFPAVREVTLTSATQITMIEQKSPAEMEQEVRAFTKQESAAGASVASHTFVPLPSSVTTTTISLSDIKAGDTIIVTAASNIMSVPSFTATAVQDNRT
jgi:hypothetical protein